jgi:uncharacterized protein YbjT (DUF2867 family)
MMTKVLVSGGTGLLGQGLLPLLASSGSYEVRCFVRPTSRVELLGETELAYGDARDEESLVRALSGVDVFVHLAGVEYAPQVVSAMRRAGVQRLLIVSSTSAHSSFASRSEPKLAMEKVVKESGLDWTVVRPTMIYGSERDKNMRRLLRFLDRSPVFPIFGPGDNLWQPVYYEDLAAGVLAALEHPGAVGESYDLPGAEPLAYRELVRVAACALGQEVRTVHLPLEPVYRGLRLVERTGVSLPVSSDQVQRLREDKAYPYEKARRELGYSPRRFEEGIELEVKKLRDIGRLRRARG